MWIYDKYAPRDTREAQCPQCGRPTTAHFEDGKLVMIEYCPDCPKAYSAENLSYRYIEKQHVEKVLTFS